MPSTLQKKCLDHERQSETKELNPIKGGQGDLVTKCNKWSGFIVNQNEDHALLPRALLAQWVKFEKLCR